MFNLFRRTASTVISTAILSSKPISSLLQNITMQQQIYRIINYIFLCIKIILVCNNGVIDPIDKTEIFHFTVSTLKICNRSKFLMYLDDRKLRFWRNIYRVRVHAPSILAGVHAISKASRCLLSFDESRCIIIYLLFFLMLLLLPCFWQIHKCIKIQLDSLSFER